MPPYPEEPDYYSEPTAAARYGGYDHAPEPPEPPTPWYRRPWTLIAVGAIGVILLGLVVFAVVKLATGSPAPSPATSTAPVPSTTAAPATKEPPQHHGPGGGGEPTDTVTETAPPESSTDTPTTTVPPSTETSTVTQTVTEPPRRPIEPRR